jgi:hypothetical protein
VVAQGGITRSRLDDALGLLEAGGSDPIGIVLNRTRRPLAIRSPALPTAGVPSTLGVSPRAPLAAGKPATPAEPGRAPAHLAAALPAAPSVESPAPESPAAADAVELPSVVVAAPAAEIAPPAEPAMVERPIVVRPDPPRPVSRFAPDPTRFGQRLTGAYANAPAPTPPAEASEEPQVTGTVVNTVSVAVQREVAGAATVPPPIRHILPRPAQKAVEGPPPTQRAAPLKRQPVFLPSQLPLPVDDTRAVPPKAGSLLREIGGLRGVEVRTARPTADDGAPDAEREARESYEQRARQLEHVAHERLMREQERLAAGIREQLAHDKRELASVLDNRLEDTVLRPIPLPVRRVPVRRSGVPAETPGDAR